MAYSAPITREHPACLVLLLDQSEPEAHPDEEQADWCAHVVADAANQMLQQLVIRCCASGEVRNYYYVSAIRYGGGVESAFSGMLAGQTLVSIADVAEYPARREPRVVAFGDPDDPQRDRETTFLTPVWIDLHPAAGAPMREGLERAKAVVELWLAEHPEGFPPTVLHLTANESNDGDPTPIARRITNLGTNDGAALLFQCHFSAGPAPRAEYPATDFGLPSDRARSLFDISSMLPDRMRASAKQAGFALQEGAKGFVYNGDARSVLSFLRIAAPPDPGA